MHAQDEHGDEHNVNERITQSFALKQPIIAQKCLSRGVTPELASNHMGKSSVVWV
jgi:hypothetical protein